MYKLLNKIFGWDYIYWANTADSGVSRVYKNADGVAYYYRYRSIALIDIIYSKTQVIFLTCSSSKYLGEDDAKNK